MVILLEQEKGYPEEFDEFDFPSQSSGNFKPRDDGDDGQGALDSVVCGTLNMERLKEMAKEDGRDFAPLLDILEGGETLENLFEDRSQLRRPPGRMSSLLKTTLF